MTESGTPEKIKIPNRLERLLRERRCVAYVGAGFSMTCGMPNWEGLLRHLVESGWQNLGGVGQERMSSLLERCSRAVNAQKFELAASIIRKILSEAEIIHIMIELFDSRRLDRAPKAERERMQQRLKYLVCGPWAGLVTTNFDRLIEDSLSEWKREVMLAEGTDNGLGAVLINAAKLPFFVKIHGTIGGKNLVLSTEDYDRLYLGSPKMSFFLQALMLNYHLVFIGCSLLDRVVELRRELAYHFDGVIPKAYALLSNSQDNRDRSEWLSELAQIDSILYPDSDINHISVDSFLKRCFFLG